MGEVDHRSHDHRVVLAPAHVHDEGSVDFEFIDRQALEVGERGVPGAEIVDGKAQADIMELGRDLQRIHRIVHDGALSDLEGQTARFDIPLAKKTADLIRQVVALEAYGGDVDGDIEVVSLAQPLGELTEGLIECPRGQRTDEAYPFGVSDELVGGNETLGRVKPTRQGFRAAHPAGRHLDLGLVMERELVPLDGAAKFAGQGEAPHASLIVFRVINRNRDIGRFRRVHGNVRALQEF